MRSATWLNGRVALGILLVVVAVLAGALFLERAQQLVPVYAAARDLPSGVPLRGADLTVVRVRLPAAQLGRYLRPTPGRPLAGRMLAEPLRRDALVPLELLVTSATADLVELAVQADAGDMAQDLRPGDRVQVLAAYTEGARRGRAVLLLQDAEVIRVLEEAGGLTGPGQQHGVQLRIPGGQATDVAAAVATARIFIVKGPALPDAAAPTGDGTDQGVDGATPDPTGAGRQPDGPAWGRAAITLPGMPTSTPGRPT